MRALCVFPPWQGPTPPSLSSRPPCFAARRPGADETLPTPPGAKLAPRGNNTQKRAQGAQESST